VYVLIVPVWRSTDLVTWTRVSDPLVKLNAMPTLAPWVTTGHNWAPAVLERPANPPASRFVMWYTARDTASGYQCLGVATAASPAGPFVDNSATPAYCQLSDQGTIDASPFIDDDGTPYLTYRSEAPAQLWISRLAPSGTGLVGGTERLLMTGGAPDADVVEAPTMIRNAGQLYLFYSTGDWSTPSYHVGVAKCDSVAGPCNRMYSTAVLGSRGAALGPGGQTPFKDTHGQWHMMFHAWTDPNVGYPSGARSLRLLPLTIDATDVKIG
jgi:beta-xylosidase